MEVKRCHLFFRTAGLCLLAMLGTYLAAAQAVVKTYSISEGRMLIRLSKSLPESSLDSFIHQYDLGDVGLKQLLYRGRPDSLLKAGWHLVASNSLVLSIAKPLEVIEDLMNPGDKLHVEDKYIEANLLPLTGTHVAAGFNRFRNKQSFREADSLVTFFLRNNLQASAVLLAGTFTQWQRAALPMQKTDSGWIVTVTLGAGKHWYKFIADSRWMVDADNQNRENDGRGNINSVFYKPNHRFQLKGFTQARKVLVAGSFNNWKRNEMELQRNSGGWSLPVYLAPGTHTYRFIVDGQWMEDPDNPERFANEYGAYNSVVQKGTPHHFVLKEHLQAQAVFLTGSFNNWRTNELRMMRTDTGWVLPYVLGPGNYQYQFVVDGKRVKDPAQKLSAGNNSFLIVQPNYSFRLKGYQHARQVFLAGDFNDWSPTALQMTREGDSWVYKLHLPAGKTRYKYVVDGHWMLDPDNPLWEQNEEHTGNSLIWLEQQ